MRHEKIIMSKKYCWSTSTYYFYVWHWWVDAEFPFRSARSHFGLFATYATRQNQSNKKGKSCFRNSREKRNTKYHWVIIIPGKWKLEASMVQSRFDSTTSRWTGEPTIPVRCIRRHEQQRDREILHSEFRTQGFFIPNWDVLTFLGDAIIQLFPFSSVGFAAMASHCSFGNVGTYLLARSLDTYRIVPSDLQPCFWLASHCPAYCRIVVFPDVNFWQRWDILLLTRLTLIEWSLRICSHVSEWPAGLL